MAIFLVDFLILKEMMRLMSMILLQIESCQFNNDSGIIGALYHF